MLATLVGEARVRLLRAYAPKSKGPLQSAIRKFAKFSRFVSSRQLFVVSKFTGDRAASAHNEWTLILFVEWLIKDISEKRVSR